MKKHIPLLISALMVSPYALASAYIIEAKAMFDVKSGELIANPSVVIENNKIVEISSHGKTKYNQPAEKINLREHTLLPGLFDMHVHLTSDAHIHGYKRLQVTSPRAAITGVRNAQRTINAGFTSVRNLGAPGYADIALRDAIYAGDVVGPRVFAAGPSLGITGGHCDNNLLPHEIAIKAAGVADGPWAVRAKVRENIKFGSDVIKFCATGGVLSKGTQVGAQQYAQEEMDALVAEAHLRGLTVAAHAHGTDGIKAAIRAGVDSIEHASFLDDEAIKLAKQHGTYLSMDIYNTEYILSEGQKAGILEESLDKERVVGAKQRNSFNRAVNANLNMVFGSDAGVYPHGENAKQFSRMVKFGMTPEQALQAATINAAKLLKQDQILGSIEVGKLADIIAIKGDPIADITLMEQVGFVLKDGKILKQ